ncbi:hypothetical protein M1M34_gp049 [Haloarcula tailed virus 2]|uniref:Uncharacterized protein n=1 Tax=Haloarcula tailed virus 2 TaxID=2877989 RepID=A0AAE9BY45_9CAUD|nr:hypothetical protein M1M34_gp049 [Haloarcula tailed virus 2]UBF23200.1 hypothetical protein HATV-2_gp49 [Haloarcula tailed virus 2]
MFDTTILLGLVLVAGLIALVYGGIALLFFLYFRKMFKLAMKGFEGF